MNDDVSEDDVQDSVEMQEVISAAASALQRLHGVSAGLLEAMNAVWCSAASLHVSARVACGEPFSAEDFATTARMVFEELDQLGVLSRQAASAEAQLSPKPDPEQKPQRTTAPCCCAKCRGQRAGAN